MIQTRLQKFRNCAACFGFTCSTARRECEVEYGTQVNFRVLKSKINETTSARVDDVGSIAFQFFLRLSAAS